MQPDILMIIGPTGIGKSDFALQKARDCNGVIISADAFQVYKGMDIGTAKVSASIRAEIPHHLIDIRTPHDAYSVADFLTETHGLIHTLREQKKPIILCGGTAFYLYAFLYGYRFDTLPEDMPVLRKRLEERLAIEGLDALTKELKSVSTESIDYQNPRRVLRALEQYYSKGMVDEKTRTPEARTDVKIIGLRAPREQVVERINKRVDQMIEEGLVEEVKKVLESGVSETAPALQAIGYKEVIQHLHGSITHAEMVECIKIKTRQFSKRQMTWFKRFHHAEWIELS